MDLHRVEGSSDWDDIPTGDRNVWQKIAARTHGVVTVGNLFSLLGLLSIPSGLILIREQSYWPAIVVLALGRLCDLLDGWLADKTGTKSPLGEKLDASFDKVSTAAVLLGMYAVHFISLWTVVLLLGPHAIIAALALFAFSRGRQFHPSVVGKFSMAAIWLTILTLVAYDASGHLFEDTGRMFVQGVLGITVALCVAALVGYVVELYHSLNKA